MIKKNQCKDIKINPLQVYSFYFLILLFYPPFLFLLLARAFGELGNAITASFTAVAIGLVVAATNRVIDSDANAVFLFGFLDAIVVGGGFAGC